MKNDGKVAAVFSIKEIEENPLEIGKKGRQLYLYRIAVAPECQGLGVGREACEWVQNYATRMRKQLYLDCWAGNERLRSFYGQAGFHYLGDFPEEGYEISVFRYPQ